MSARKTVIVGGVAGGASTAARLRRLDEDMEIILLERGEHISYANCGLPYFIGGVIEEREKLFVTNPQKFSDWFNVDVRIFNEAIRIDRQGKRVQVVDRRTGETYWESYTYLVLAPGAEPVKPRLPGIDLPAVFTLRNVADTDRLAAFIAETKPAVAVIVGGGFIGLEMVENLQARGLAVSVVEAAPQVLPNLDLDMAACVQQYLRSRDVALHLNDGVAGFRERAEGGVEVDLQSGGTIPADMVLLSIGVRPEIKLAEEAGLETGRGIIVNEFMQTSDPAIYALGDAVEVKNLVTGAPAVIPLAGPANKQGRLVANNIVGRRDPYRGTQGTAVLKIFDLTIASTGPNERALREAGLESRSCVIHPASHADYYPGGRPMVFKLLFGNDGRIFGAQAVGFGGVDKRIDVVAAAQRSGQTVYDLQALELAYAPPYSSARDPVNVAGFVAANILNGDVQTIDCRELLPMDKENLQIVDVREAEECAEGAIPGAVNIPLGQLRRRLAELDPQKDTVVYCAVGLRAYLAARILMQKGFRQVRNLSGGYRLYRILEEEESR